MLATVLVPTHDHGAMLALSVGSVLTQTVTDLEVLIVGDGPTDETRAVGERLAASDSRVRWLEYPKRPSRGELSRHEALREARGRLVLYLSDDDLWLPEHVERMAAVFDETGADFVHGAVVWIKPGGELLKWTVDLGLPYYRRIMRDGDSRIGLSAGAHTLDAYRRLPEGWRTTPAGRYTDHWMWLQFLETEGMTFAALHTPTLLILPTSIRREATYEERLAEHRRYASLIAEERGRRELLERLAADQSRRFAWLEANRDETRAYLERHTEESAAWVANRNAEIDRLSSEAGRLHSELALAAERSAPRGVRRWLRTRKPT